MICRECGEERASLAKLREHYSGEHPGIYTKIRGFVKEVDEKQHYLDELAREGMLGARETIKA